MLKLEAHRIFHVVFASFPNTTIMFADISGFTAWASTREPFQVFQLLETLFGSLDRIARARKIFKVWYCESCSLPDLVLDPRS